MSRALGTAPGTAPGTSPGTAPGTLLGTLFGSRGQSRVTRLRQPAAPVLPWVPMYSALLLLRCRDEA
ncbi:hypothetical protein CffCFBP3418_01025 [Curtobacterium flaccumfaciens pv. flaccumfaciens]|nr:hypothetical protein CffCFBP3418_01025 [Curtobacterium flaccumfaciens pv. flaccumfaciens]